MNRPLIEQVSIMNDNVKSEGIFRRDDLHPKMNI